MLPPLVAFVGACVYVSGEPGVTQAGGLGMPLDDSWIHLQFAVRLAAGDGLSFNPGEWVTGSTAPLWTALLAFLTVLPGSILVWAKLLGATLHAACADATTGLAHALGLGRRMALLGGLLTALSGWLLWAAPSAMEIPLATFLMLWGIRRHVEERRAEVSAPTDTPRPPRLPQSLAILALATLARPEAALLLVLAAMERVVVWRRSMSSTSECDGDEIDTIRPHASRGTAWLEGFVLAAIVLAPTLIFYRAVGDSWLPSTFAVKGSHEISWMPNLRYLRVVMDVLFRSQPILLMATVAGALRLLANLGSKEDRGLLPALWFFGLPLAYGLVSPPGGPFAVGNFGRYYFPIVPVLIVLALVGLAPFARRLPRLSLGRFRLGLATVATTLLIGLALADATAGRTRYLRSVSNVETSDVSAAAWLAKRLPPEALIATQDIGAIKYMLPNSVVDLAGIVTPEVIEIVRGPSDSAQPWEQRLLTYLAQRKPDILVVFPAFYPQISRTRGFVEVASFEVPDNITMAANRLAIFTTPWNRFPLAP